MEQETLEEAAENYTIDFATMSAFKLGAQWQQERMYSEEEVKEIVKIAQSIKNYGDYKPFTFEECIEQFKKK
jgi:alpha-L-fucosidase